jgi:type I restriction enzyme S subunit
MHIEKIKIRKGTAEILQGMDGKLSGVLFTHLHFDHISGMPDIPNDVPLYIGAGESTASNFKNMFVRGATNQLLQDKQPLQEWHFQADPQNQFEGIIDVFEDGSVFAISVPGHTPGIRIPVLQSIKIPIFPLKEQTEIASLLGAIDDRIALLLETNATLEAIAQAMFKSWFVDFEPVHAKQQGLAPEGMSEATAALFPNSFQESELGFVPKGWRASTMDGVSVVGIGKTPPRKEPQWFSENSDDVRWVSIRDMGISGAFISQTSEYLTVESIERFNVRQVPDNTVLLSFKMTIGRVALTDGEMTTNEAIAHFKLDEKSPLTSEFIYLHLKQFNYLTLSSTSSIADAVNSKTVKTIPILVPDATVMLAFQDAVRPVFERIKLIQQQAQSLATLRDTLLPRLISGQPRLPEAEAALEEMSA